MRTSPRFTDRMRTFGQALAITAVLLGLASLSAGHRQALGQTVGPSLPSLSIVFGPQQIYQPSADAVHQLFQCHNQSLNCVKQIMQGDGASEDAIAFYRLTGWFLSDIQEMGPVKLGTIFTPWRANENTQTAFLGGTPAVIFPEQEAQLLNFAGAVERDTDYGSLKDAYPDVMFWVPGPTLEGAEALPDGGQRFILDYRLLNGCHACAIVGSAREAFDFAADGTFEGTRLLNVLLC